MSRLTREEANQCKQENSLENWSKLIMHKYESENTEIFEQKRKAFNNLNKEQTKELKVQYESFESMLWMVEPEVDMFGIVWSHSDLYKLFNKTSV